MSLTLPDAPRTNEIVGADHLVNRTAIASPHTAEHMQRVGRTAGLLMSELGLDSTAAFHAEVSGYLHDVGKEPYLDLVEAPRKLTDDEWTRLARHASGGGKLIMGLLPENPSLEAQVALGIASQVTTLHHASPEQVEALKANPATEYVGHLTDAIQKIDHSDAMSDRKRGYHKGKIKSAAEIRAIVLGQTATTTLFGHSPEKVLSIIHSKDLLDIH